MVWEDKTLGNDVGGPDSRGFSFMLWKGYDGDDAAGLGDLGRQDS